MSFMDLAIFNTPVTVTLDDYGTPYIRIRCGHGQLGVTPAEAVKLRDELSSAITEAATAAAKAVQTEGEAA